MDIWTSIRRLLSKLRPVSEGARAMAEVFGDSDSVAIPVIIKKAPFCHDDSGSVTYLVYTLSNVFLGKIKHTRLD